ncbi:MAG: polysaccharide pyruvyl transferase [Cytophagales bacterium CG18_big_fil_WC_8_21_14_2_50_42_9]|nr:MAG: polysaccharide pyruvyl transferase [Cytophagales bacterium CG18_big_fil_WC_8_21_14_2_50_42_9]
MNTNSQNLLHLRSSIYQSLDSLIKQDYCLLDVPDHNNIGDQLIYQGELEYLKRLPYKMLYSANETYTRLNKIPEGCTILLHGGGNFGDLWRWFQTYRLNIIKHFPENKIIVLPQTVYYKNPAILEQDAKVFNNHTDLTICVRDTTSYDILKKYCANSNILLVPDMAFCLNLDKYLNKNKTHKALIFERKDQEINANYSLAEVKKLIPKEMAVDIADWPSYGKTKATAALQNYFYKANRVISRKLKNTDLIDDCFGLNSNKISTNYLLQGINFINQYDEVYTTRLHGYILSVLLDKKVYLIDNSYGKNSTFYNTWMHDFKNSYLLDKITAKKSSVL